MSRDVLPKESKSFWHLKTMEKKYPKLTENLTVDVAVIGGGIAGILSAYELSRRGKTVALLEARDMLYGTTGFTTSKLSAQHNIIYHELIQRYGKEKARLYYEANMEGMEIIKHVAREHDIKCQLEEQDAYAYTQMETNTEVFVKEAQAYEALSIKGHLVKEMPIALPIEAGVVMHHQYQFHPVMFLTGVLHELEKMKVLIFEQSMVTKVHAGDPIILETEQGHKVTCEQVICASHYPVYDPEKYYTDHMDPEISFATVYKYHEPYQGGMYISYDNPRRTIRSIDHQGEKFILVGGESHRLGTGSSDKERYERIAEFAQETFGVNFVLAKWSSHDYLTKDKIPFIGLADEKSKNIYVVTGLNKWGLTNAAVGSKILADLIQGKDNPYSQLFLPFRDIPNPEGTNEKETKEKETRHKYARSTSKKTVEELEKGEALIYEQGEESFGVFKDDENRLHSLNITCTHLGCTLGWNDGDKTWDCKCHGSRFNYDGKVIEGPATESLELVQENHQNHE